MSAEAAGRAVARVVRGRIGYALIDPVTPTPVMGRTVELCWDSTDPDAVALVFGHTARGEVCWRVARQLLVDGLYFPVGLGDVSLLPDLTDPALRELVLSSPDGRVGMWVHAGELAGFLTRTGLTLPDLFLDPAAGQHTPRHHTVAEGGVEGSRGGNRAPLPPDLPNTQPLAGTRALEGHRG